ncbi:TP53-target gene 5 protein isoform X2 [Rhinatrema bivittatum]|uniref:TP53-target gene 5 protein isoform X2 n=1 Tax=Rhinatrema bivittatum TaxID=194408 RepID=UPI0011279D30|nr:TP53-target gene 5 protein isoform X2 [Rhinatrema bivittatum]
MVKTLNFSKHGEGLKLQTTAWMALVQSGMMFNRRKRFFSGKQEHNKEHIKTIIKQLTLLRLLKGPDGKFQRLHNLATKCLKIILVDLPENISKQELRKTDWEFNEQCSQDPHPLPPPQLPIAYQNQWFDGIPQRLQLPAPKVLCRPSPLRWIKPCCTRSCDESLEKPITFQYSP